MDRKEQHQALQSAASLVTAAANLVVVQGGNDLAWDLLKKAEDMINFVRDCRAES